MKKINKKDLVDEVALKAHLSAKDSRRALDVAFEMMERELLAGNEVNISNFGTFNVKTRARREGTHPKNHTRLVIEEAKNIVFKTSKKLKAKINK